MRLDSSHQMLENHPLSVILDIATFQENNIQVALNKSKLMIALTMTRNTERIFYEELPLCPKSKCFEN